MATVESGRVVLFGAGGPVGAAAITALKNLYELRVTDFRPMAEIASEPSPQGPRRPVPEVLGPPHENRVVDVFNWEQVRSACEGMDAAINLSVLRSDLIPAFRVSAVGAYNIATAAVDCGLKRLIHTGPFHTSLNHDADYHNDFQVSEDIPLHPGDDLYALSKYIGGEWTKVIAERCGLEVLTFLYCGFLTRTVYDDQIGRGLGPFSVSIEDAGEAFVHGLRAPSMPSPYEVFFINAPTPDQKYPPKKAKQLLGWEAKDQFEKLYTRPEKANP